MKVAVVGATGMVGEVMLKVLAERNFPVTELLVVASERSVGKKLSFQGKEYTLIGLETAVAAKPDVAIFSAGGDTSLEWAPKFAAVGTTVIDNSSAWRMDPTKKLVVPEINASELTKEDKIIANPNCSTIQMVLALSSLHKKYKMKRVVVSTYQSVSGTGVKAVQQLENEIAGIKGEMAYPYPIGKNALPHCDVFLENGYTKEEMKLAKEPQKIFNDNSFSVTATAVRIPTSGGHSESVNVEFENDFELSEVRRLLSETPGIVVQDNTDTNTYPMPIYAHGKDDVFVGRIRRDETQANTLNMWIVADNLRKGAATNAVQIAEYLVQNQLV
ncbi:aspartate-semialdehyde dehydrogenase [Arenibacter algicola]|jgi:aspartate-semialdehyde dehydrogenase|uniref:Aspartate-semialdehyde dehydrogenase n=1 Tax=Arenibacter algicola TaxID=616991 RepID=A0A221UTH2_9FLAO|nr:aspartate-semialdehyde dehydrogenase [Arenibacter algicola]ASO04689.1 aspartate-semialdehyde dehydrogenase [Arenibacter algicola]MDX1758522.1 aspartate-semialdehyde dehydrogenase [Arenibacter algicola]HCO84387.1 aspartate-semialdehyde dehydrogenase [Arenibacter sp.]|tara:strand:- start:27325 stop:28314 length:990 start_codon:yes stop_codon:yes gene_type:complete|eukprot:TRINITY_DN6499_c0_g1_i2.p2 TRINITY_DN6499_c0_g1~~TRINITY_DN6499_c0_g1_i2.p2  ORF type:complete len:330 (-),score=78.97 TRINITY_DN6499_c0_g1_i2:2898-3887(-)